MNMWKTVAVTVGAIALLIGILFGTGTLRVNTPSSVEEDAEGGVEDGGDRPKRSARARSKGRGKGKRRGGKRGKNIDSLPYLGGIPMTAEDRAKKGVTLHLKGKAGDYLSVYCPNGWGVGMRDAPADAPWQEAKLIDISGKELHAWRSEEFRGQRKSWSVPKISDRGEFFVLQDERAVLKLDWHSNTIWRAEGNFHHDFAIEDDGGVVVLIEQRRTIDFEGRELTIRDQGFTFVDREGVVGRTLWFYDVFKDDPTFQEKIRSVLARHKGKGKIAGADVFHANTVEIMRLEPKGPWQKGDLMTSFRHQDLVSVISRDGKIRWKWGPDVIEQQHDPSETSKGTILVFDNGFRRKWSRVVEVDPSTSQIVWSWPESAKPEFFSSGRGLAELLPNGNVFVVSSNQGNAFEITREGEKVWEFWTPYQWEDHRLPFRMVRLTGEALAATRANLAKPPAPVKSQQTPPKPAAPTDDEAPSDDGPSETEG